MSEVFSTKDEKLAVELASEIMVTIGIVTPQGYPRIVSVATEKHNGLIYEGSIVIEDPNQILELSEMVSVLHPLKCCFKGNYQKAQSWMVEEFCDESNAHSFVNIVYTITRRNSDGNLVVRFHRNMAESGGFYGACKLHGNQEVVPLGTADANWLMTLFSEKAVRAIEGYIFEKEIRYHPDYPERSSIVPPHVLILNMATALT